MLLQVPLVLRFTHVFQMQLLLMCWRLSALRAERWLPPRRPSERNDGREIDESIAKGHAAVLNTTQRDAVRHHCHVLPFVSEVAERLWGCEEGIGEREELQLVLCAIFALYHCRTRTAWIVSTSFWPCMSCPMIGPLSSGVGSLVTRCHCLSRLG